MRRHLFTLASALSLLLCVATVVLWVRGAGRAEGWYFKPSPTVVLQPPPRRSEWNPDLPAKWCVQWQVNWGTNATISVNRQFKPIPRQPRIGFFSIAHHTSEWNPLPKSERVPDPRIAATAIRAGGQVASVAYRTKPATAWSHLGIAYASHEQEFVTSPGFAQPLVIDGGWFLRVPLLYLFLLFALLPALWTWRTCRTWRVPAGHCPTCRYNLTGNTTGVCPECGSDVRTHPPENSG